MDTGIKNRTVGIGSQDIGTESRTGLLIQADAHTNSGALFREYVLNANFVLRAGFAQQIKRWFFSFGANLR